MPLQDPQYFESRFAHFSGRHNPHPNRVTHFKGLLDLPVRIVRDPPHVVNRCHTYAPYTMMDYKSRSAWDLTQSAAIPTGLSPNGYKQWQVAAAQNRFDLNSDTESDRVSHVTQYGTSSAKLRMPVGFLNLARPRARVPNNDLITGLQYFTGLRNYSVRGRPNLGSMIEADARQAQYGNVGRMQPWSLPVERDRWKQELTYMTGTILGHLDWTTSENVDNATGQPSTALETYREPTLRAPASDRIGREPWLGSGNSSQGPFPSQRAPSLQHHSANRPWIDSTKQFSPSVNAIPMQSYELQVFNMICSILQTNDTTSVKHWLLNASEREKNLVIAMLCSALSNQQSYCGPWAPRRTTLIQPQLPAEVHSLIHGSRPSMIPVDVSLGK
ncbi:hypothetical protein FGIG_08166 [Fasciola gigantica]|uniref:Protein TBATA n=1 Tax=Fasciola gigantica TaxID=46835 RepID=A0A504Z5P6_FASGI|nr:hypothetical protein FGIG_08166 [Fasciola gigantica]